MYRGPHVMIEIRCNEHNAEADIRCNDFATRNESDGNQEQQWPEKHSVGIRIRCCCRCQNRQSQINPPRLKLLNRTVIFQDSRQCQNEKKSGQQKCRLKCPAKIFPLRRGKKTEGSEADDGAPKGSLQSAKAQHPRETQQE